MNRDKLYERVLQSTSPHRDELDRLYRLKEKGLLTEGQYARERADVLRAFEAAAVR